MHWAKKSTVKDRGDLYLYNIEDSVNKAEKLKISGSKGFVHTDFFPTGLSVFKLSKNSSRLIVQSLKCLSKLNCSRQ